MAWATDPNFNDFSMFFHFYKFQDIFMKLNYFSMILKQISISMIFQGLWETYIWHWFALLHCMEPPELAPGNSARRIDAILKEDATAAASSGWPLG